MAISRKAQTERVLSETREILALPVVQDALGVRGVWLAEVANGHMRLKCTMVGSLTSETEMHSQFFSCVPVRWCTVMRQI